LKIGKGTWGEREGDHSGPLSSKELEGEKKRALGKNPIL